MPTPREQNTGGMPREELREELEAIRIAILSLEQFTVPRVEESDARRKVENLLALLDVGTF